MSLALSALFALACASTPEPATQSAATEATAATAATGAEHHGSEHHGSEHHGSEHHGTADSDDDATMQHGFSDAAKWAQVFDNPERDAWQKPAELVAALDLPVGGTVADIGAGTGYFNPHLAAAVGGDGTVIAVDIEPDMVQHMRDRAVKEDTPQVRARLGQPDDPGLTEGEADVVLLVDTYHHISDRTAYFTALRTTLRPGGRLVVVDFKPGDIPVGPPEAHRISQEKVVSELTAAGWTLGTSPDLLPYQFVQIMWRDAPAP